MASAQGLVSGQERAPLPLPDCEFLPGFYNLWLEAVQNSILSCAAVVPQMGRWNNCAPCWGCLNCWNKLLSPPPHLQHTHINPCSSWGLPVGGLSVRSTKEGGIYLGNNHFAVSHTQMRRRGNSPWSSATSWAAPLWSFVPPLNWYWMAPWRDSLHHGVGWPWITV